MGDSVACLSPWRKVLNLLMCHCQQRMLRTAPLQRVRPFVICITTMASADFCDDIDAPCEAPSLSASPQISQGKTRDFPPIYPPHIRWLSPNDIGLRVYAPPRPPSRRLGCGSCASDQEFACCFLQIPPHGGHPCSSARSSCHQGLHRDSHPTSHFLVRFRSPVPYRHLPDDTRHA